LNQIKISSLAQAEPIPYELLLLADPSIARIEAYIFDSKIYVAQSRGKTIGVFVLQDKGEGIAEIKNIAVVESLQGQGIGKLLLKAACSIAKADGFKIIQIGTGNSSIGQLYLYQREGFSISNIVKDFFTNSYPEPIYENGILCQHMIVLAKDLAT